MTGQSNFPRGAPRVLLLSNGEIDPQHDLGQISSAGCEGILACDLSQALAQARPSPSLLLVDARTAWADGSGEQCARLKSTELGTVPTVLLADSGTPAELIESCWKTGFDDCVLRPLSATHLTGRLQTDHADGRSAVRPERDVPRTILLYGAAGSLQSDLHRALELNGYRILERSPTEPAESSSQAPADLVVIHGEAEKITGLLCRVRESAVSRTTPVLLVSTDALHRPAPIVDPALIGLLGPADAIESIAEKANKALLNTSRNLRASECVPFFCPVEFREWGGKESAPWSCGFSFAVSASGLFLRTMVPIRPRVALELRIYLTTTREQITATGVVAWSRPFGGQPANTQPGEMGVQFLGMPLSKRLAQLIAVCAKSKEGSLG